MDLMKENDIVDDVFVYNPTEMEMDSNSNSPAKLLDTETSIRKDVTSVTSLESEFDDTLIVPPSLSLINVAPSNEIDTFDSPAINEKIQLPNTTPFTSIFNKPIKFNSTHRKVFMPGVEVHIKITGFERNVTSHILYPNLYTIQLSHGDFSWTVIKRYKHIMHLHQQLVLYRTGLNIPFPTKLHKEHRQSIKNLKEQEDKDDNKPQTSTRKKSNRLKIRSPALPRFPKKPEVLVSYDDIPKRMRQLEDYLYSLCNISIYRNHHELINFLEVSHLSFISDIGVRGREGMVKKRAGSTLPGQTGCDCCGLLQNSLCTRLNFICGSFACGRWRDRWFFVKDSFLGYICPYDGAIKSIMLFDQGFDISSGMYSTGLNNGVQIINLNRQLILKFLTKRQSKEWRIYIKDVANNQARDFTGRNPHRSFVPMRTSIRACSFIDGGGYFSAVADCLEAAKEEIYITDWWLSPEIYMKRPIIGDYWRLDTILKRKASQGVKVFILLYKEVEMALGICSYYSKTQLNHENIKVLRHPDHAKAGVFLWAHHEKIICIDQSVAFVGGIDLCYGRFDDHKHRLTDLGTIKRENSTYPKTKKKTSSSPGGVDFYCVQLEEEQNCDDNLPTSNSDLVEDDSNKNENPTNNSTIENSESKNKPLPVLQPGDQLLMPARITSNTVFLEDHYNPEALMKRNIMDTITDKSKEILNFFGSENAEPGSTTNDNLEKLKAERYASTNLFFPERETPEGSFKKSILTKIPEDELSLSVNDIAVQTSSKKDNSKLWLGKDYANFIVKDFVNLNSPFVDLVDRATTPRMPWHDIATMVEGEAARDVARHFIQRWNAHKLEKVKNNPSYPYLMPKSYANINVPNILPNLEKYTVSCQILRSLTSWSGGFVDPESCEQSIHEAYVDSITRAQHYVYIENQFFITLSISSVYVRNQIGEAIFSRILRAHKANKKFKVFVIMPLLPAFEGEVGASSGTSLHAITHWNYQSISRGEDSLIVRLKKAGIEDPSEYITFHGLRTHSVLEGEPVSELIYVHSKLMIVDDRVVICGSANINDRSMLGCRDSEVAVLIQDETFEDGAMNGEIFPSGCFAGSLRKRLFREHLGLIGRGDLQKEINIKDPIIESFYRDVWQYISQQNTEIYENVFHCIPTDSVKTFAELKHYQEDNKRYMWEDDPETANNEIDKIKGPLVNFPLEFLSNEVLTPPSKSVFGIMPTSLWT